VAAFSALFVGFSGQFCIVMMLRGEMDAFHTDIFDTFLDPLL
jgi:hypothetical protein